MRPTLLAVGLLCLAIAGPSWAWIEYSSHVDHFAIVFPAEPTVREIGYVTEHSLTLPARLYSYEGGGSRYSVTVVDFADTERKHADRLARCREELGDGDSCNNPWDTERHGAIVFASWSLMKEAAKVTEFNYAVSDGVEGHQLQLTNADGSRTFAAIFMHEDRLYILEGTVPARAPAPGIFQQSLGFIDANGDRIRYRSAYSNGHAPPPSFTYQP